MFYKLPAPYLQASQNLCYQEYFVLLKSNNLVKVNALHHDQKLPQSSITPLKPTNH